MNAGMKTNLIIAGFMAAAVFLAPHVSEAKQAKGKKSAPESAEEKFHLKPDARQKLCLTCHTDIEAALKKPFVHTPVKQQGCTACHSPHTTAYPKQLSADVNKLCLTCHAALLPKDARSAHRPVLEGRCVQCHDPHASNNKYNLLKSGNDVCFECHKDKADAVAKAKFKHAPVGKGCINCHNPHASSGAPSLLKQQVPDLCKDCHQIDKPLFAKQHQNYPVGGSKCTLCHNAHGSDKAGLIYTTAHRPFMEKACNQCHEGPGSPKPLALKKQGFELCRGCHSTQVNNMLTKNRLHWPVMGKDGCLNCHTPHASTQDKLLTAPPLSLCGSCHADTIQRQESSPDKHEPMQDGLCTVCHDPHASNNVQLFQKSSTIELCGQCHDWEQHATHPIGEKVKDKRNRNLTMQCLSCHRAHGTGYKKMLQGATITDLCTQCHVEYKR